MEQEAHQNALSDQAKAIGKVVTCWGAIQTYIIVLDIMKVSACRFRPRSEGHLNGLLPMRWERFELQCKRALEGLNDILQRVFSLKKIRDEIFHGATLVEENPHDGSIDAVIVNVDVAATVFAKKWPPKYFVAPTKGPRLKNNDILKVAFALQDLVKIFEMLVHTVRSSDREYILHEVDEIIEVSEANWSANHCSKPMEYQQGKVVGFIGEFVMYAAQVERSLRTLELMHSGKRGKNFEAIESDKIAATRWQERPRTRPISKRIRHILKDNPKLVRKAHNFFKFRNFVLHNPLVLTGDESEVWMPAFCDRRLVAVRDARVFSREKINDNNLIPQWAWEKQDKGQLMRASLHDIAQHMTIGGQLLRDFNGMAYHISGNPALRWPGYGCTTSPKL